MTSFRWARLDAEMRGEPYRHGRACAATAFGLRAAVTVSSADAATREFAAADELRAPVSLTLAQARALHLLTVECGA